MTPRRLLLAITEMLGMQVCSCPVPFDHKRASRIGPASFAAILSAPAWAFFTDGPSWNELVVELYLVEQGRLQIGKAVESSLLQ
jgi:hypothetical protein